MSVCDEGDPDRRNILVGCYLILSLENVMSKIVRDAHINESKRESYSARNPIKLTSLLFGRPVFLLRYKLYYHKSDSIDDSPEQEPMDERNDPEKGADHTEQSHDKNRYCGFKEYCPLFLLF